MIKQRFVLKITYGTGVTWTTHHPSLEKAVVYAMKDIGDELQQLRQFIDPSRQYIDCIIGGDEVLIYPVAQVHTKLANSVN